MKIPVLLLCVMLAIAGIRYPAQGNDKNYNAMITDIKGKVQVGTSSGTQWKPARLLIPLVAGNEIKGEKSSRITVSFICDGHRETIEGPFTLEVAPENLIVKTGSVKVQKVLKKSSFPVRHVTPSKFGAGIMKDRLTGGFEDLEIEPQNKRTIRPYPGESMLCNEAITFSFESDPALSYIIIRKKEEDGTIANPIKTLKVEKGPVTFSGKELALEPESSYEWYLAGSPAASPPPGKSGARDFSVLSEKDSSSLCAAKTAAEKAFNADPDDISPISSLVTLYLSKKAYTPAVEMLERLAVSHPGEPRLEELRSIVTQVIDEKYFPDEF